MSSLGFGCISADSHIVEPADCYTKYIDPKYRDRAPTIERDKKTGNDIYVIPGMDSTIPLGLVAAAGLTAEELAARSQGCTFDQLHESGHNAKLRVADQDRDGVASEIIYPSVGMVLCNHEDYAYKTACMHAYNEWLASYVSDAPKGRLFGLGQTSGDSVEQMIKDFEDSKEKGFVGMMMPGDPQHEDYDHPMYDPLWECAVALDMPLSFHILTSRSGGGLLGKPRGSKINGFMGIIRSVQDVMGVFVLGGVFQRHPGLKFIAAEADAGWLPHYSYRMDHAYERHGIWLGGGKNLEKMPSEYISEHVWLTFQDDWVAFKVANLMNPKRLVWANDFPHSDATWPWSQEMLEEHASGLTGEQQRWIMRENIIECYNLPADKIPA
jgi:predicted TIM-barrel fold metal-dependent hydrolase